MDKNHLEKVSACALGRIFGYEPRYIAQIVERLGSARSVFELTEKELGEAFGPFSRYRGRINAAALEEADRELEALEAAGCHFLPCTHTLFPPLLKECPDYPAGLYWRGSSGAEDIFGFSHSIGIVGTRDISDYGQYSCRKAVEALSLCPEKPVVVSGLAIGVDITAHLAALSCGLPTIAVIPTGIDSIYPKRHTAAACRIEQSAACAVVTDFPPGTSPQGVTFLRRNRIIAGLSGSLLLVESKLHGGGVITARLASGYGRQVLAVPGRIGDLRSEGCNLLLKEKIAEPLTSTDTLGEEIGLGHFERRRKAGFTEAVAAFYAGKPDCDGLQRAAGLIASYRGRTADEICEASGMSVSEFSIRAGTLEADGFISIDLLRRCHILV